MNQRDELELDRLCRRRATGERERLRGGLRRGGGVLLRPPPPYLPGDPRHRGGGPLRRGGERRAGGRTTFLWMWMAAAVTSCPSI